MRLMAFGGGSLSFEVGPSDDLAWLLRVFLLAGLRNL